MYNGAGICEAPKWPHMPPHSNHTAFGFHYMDELAQNTADGPQILCWIWTIGCAWMYLFLALGTYVHLISTIIGWVSWCHPLLGVWTVWEGLNCHVCSSVLPYNFVVEDWRQNLSLNCIRIRLLLHSDILVFLDISKWQFMQKRNDQATIHCISLIEMNDPQQITKKGFL